MKMPVINAEEDDEEDDDEDYDVGNHTTNDSDGAYKKWSQQFRSNQNDLT